MSATAMLTSKTKAMMMGGHAVSAFVLPPSSLTKTSTQCFFTMRKRSLLSISSKPSSSTWFPCYRGTIHQSSHDCFHNRKRSRQQQHCLYTTSSPLSSSSINHHEQHKENIINAKAQKANNDPIKMAEEAIFSLVTSQKNRTWRRLSHIVQLACSSSSSSSEQQQQQQQRVEENKKMTIADIGCDHGLLSIALASTKYFSKVTGVDVSSLALQNALDLYCDKVLLQDNNNEEEEKAGSVFDVPIEFRVGDGLVPLHRGEADVICIAGMGVNTMMKILFQEDTDVDNEKDVMEADEQTGECNSMSNNMLKLNQLKCQKLLLQPTNSRPRNLIMLYDSLFNNGWRLTDERIEKISSRWYITSSFARCELQDKEEKDKRLLPGDKISNDEDDDHFAQYNIYKKYVEHHISWIECDMKQKERDSNGDDDRSTSSLCEEDIRWLEKNKKQ